MMAEGGNQTKTVRFEHPFFKRMEDIYFRLDERTNEAVAVVTLGDEHLVLPFAGLRREFKLDDGPDGEMLTLLAKGLKYVKGLRVGDPLPPEIITRRASWKPEPRHHQIAYHRLAMQLLGWLSGDEHIITNPEELLQVAGDPNFKRKVNEAFSEAAEHLGLGRENKEQVIGYISSLSDELAYIEAMRDEIHVRLLPWEELLDEWHRLPSKRTEWAEQLLDRTYRFLAPRYMPVDEWAMMTKLAGAQVTIGPDGKVIKPKKTRKLGGVMEWG